MWRVVKADGKRGMRFGWRFFKSAVGMSRVWVSVCVSFICSVGESRTRSRMWDGSRENQVLGAMSTDVMRREKQREGEGPFVREGRRGKSHCEDSGEEIKVEKVECVVGEDQFVGVEGGITNQVLQTMLACMGKLVYFDTPTAIHKKG